MEVRPKPVSSHGTRFILLAAAGVRVHCYTGPVISGQKIVKTMPTVLDEALAKAKPICYTGVLAVRGCLGHGFLSRISGKT